jgi:prepilin-type processing-associated H-X9-DG protein
VFNLLNSTDVQVATGRDTLIPELTCPSNPNSLFLNASGAAGSKIALTNYKAIGAATMASLVISCLPNSPPPYGYASNHPDGTIFPGGGIRLAEISDGTAHTVMACETMDNGGTPATRTSATSAWIAGTCATLTVEPNYNTGYTADCPAYTYTPGSGAAIPSGATYPFYYPTGFNGKYDEQAATTIQALRTYLAFDWTGSAKGHYDNVTAIGAQPAMGPSAGHPSVVNFLFVDGAVRSLRKDIDFCSLFFITTKANGDPAQNIE